MTNNTLPQSPVSVAEQMAFIDLITKARIFASDQHDALLAIAESLKRLEACERDAARYLHMRDQNSSLERGASRENVSCYHMVGGVRELKSGDELDAAIDSARSS